MKRDALGEAECRAVRESEGISMTLVALGLLLGMVGLLWTMVIDIVRADRCAKTKRSGDLDNPVAGAARCESKAA